MGGKESWRKATEARKQAKANNKNIIYRSFKITSRVKSYFIWLSEIVESLVDNMIPEKFSVIS